VGDLSIESDKKTVLDERSGFRSLCRFLFSIDCQPTVMKFRPLEEDVSRAVYEYSERIDMEIHDRRLKRARISPGLSHLRGPTA
jgi:hypothetical protein